MGVPQGSILAPLLFLIYIKDFTICLPDNTQTIMFADDISLLIGDKNKFNIAERIKGVVSNIRKWFECNNLLLNMNKTNLIRFALGTSNSSKQNDIIEQIKNIVDLKIETEIKFLGITLDNKLIFKSHIDNLAKKLSSACYAIKRIKQFCGLDAAKSVYYAYFHSLMSYGLIVWGTAADANRIFILQKRAIRHILSLCPRDSCREKFKELNIMTLYSSLVFQCLIYVRRNIEKFPLNCDFHSHDTRHRGDIRLPKCRLSKFNKSYLYISLKLFNKLPIVIRNLETEKIKETIKTKLINKLLQH